MDEVISGGFTTEQGPCWSRDSVRVVSWNIERGLQFSAILDFLRAAEADLILLQEVDLNVRRTEHRDVASEIARSLHLNYAFGKEFQELSSVIEAAPAHHGLATLSPWPLSNGRIISFQRQSNFWNPRWFVPRTEIFQRRLGGRIALVTEALIYRQRIMTYNLHLESKGNDVLRVQQLREALDDAGQHRQSSAVLIGGDFNLNADEGDAAAALQSAGFVNAAQIPDKPTTAAHGLFGRARRIDWVFLPADLELVGSQVDNTILGSDHYPVSISFMLPSRLGNDAVPQVVP